MNINNYSKSSHPHSAQGKVFQQVFHSNGSFHLNQFRETNTSKDDTTRDDTLGEESINKTPEGSIPKDNVIDNLDLFNCDNTFIEQLNQDSDEFTNDDQSFENNIQLRDDPNNKNFQEQTLNSLKNIPTPASARKVLVQNSMAHSLKQNSVYEIPPNLRKPFKIPYPAYAVTPGVTPTSLITPKSKQTTGQHGRVLQFTSATLADSADKDAAHPIATIQEHNNSIEIGSKEPNEPPTYTETNAKSDGRNNETGTSANNLAPPTETQINPKNTNCDSIPNTLVFTEPPLQGENQLNEVNARTSHIVDISTPRLTNNLPVGYTIQTNLYNSTISSTLGQNIKAYINNNSDNVHKTCLPLSKTAVVHTPQLKTNTVYNSETYHSFQDSQPTGKLHISRFIDDSIKPSNESRLTLPVELESLRSLIMSQPEILAPHIIELGNINLIHSKTINKKKHSYQQLTAHNKIPRSLRIKCELTTSPSYSSNPKFIRIKEDLQVATNDYIKTGTKLMTEWAEENINLLLQDRCQTILKKALQLLDGIALYHATVIYTPNWFLSSQNHNTLLLFKLYLSDEFIDAKEIINYLEVPLDTIRLLGAKILTNNGSDETALNSFTSINLNTINLNHQDEFNFISETLIIFDQILRITTIDLWETQKEKSKQLSAAETLKARMAEFETIHITARTASAIAKATDAHSELQASSLQTSLRLANLEKAARKQDQIVNEFSKALQKNNHKIKKNKRQTTNFDQDNTVDLTEDDESHTILTKNRQQRRRLNTTVKPHDKHSSSPPKSPQRETNKMVRWNESELKQLSSQTTQASVDKQVNTRYQNSPFLRQTTFSFFQSAPPPISPPAPSPSTTPSFPLISPFNNWQKQNVSSAMNQTMLGHNNPIKNPFQIATHSQERTHPSNLAQSNRGRHTLKKKQRRK
jgi:hypothetical protein